MDLDQAAQVFREFVAVIKRLRTPGTGCPWDLEQTHPSLRPYLIEEAYEVLDAIDQGDDRALQEELGDLLLQVVLHAQVADDRGAFSITEVVRGIVDKMVRRHPHVFGSVKVSGSAEVLHNWEQIKAAEKQGTGDSSPLAALAQVPESMPALMRAQRLGDKAAKVGIDGDSVADILDQVRRDLTGLEAELRKVGQSSPPTGTSDEAKMRSIPDVDRGRLEHGLGELLFGLCQLARRLGLDTEASLRMCNRRVVEGIRRREKLAPKTPDELGNANFETAWWRVRQVGQPDAARQGTSSAVEGNSHRPARS